MNSSQIEAWALEILARVASKRAVEDDRVELKGAFIDPAEAARRIAGHLNAIRGDRALWLIGVSENSGQVLGVQSADFATWYEQVRSHFEAEVLAPTVAVVTISTPDGVVVALLFDGSRVPYVVRNASFGKPGAGPAKFEVPWREGTQVRTARHGDLIQLLVPMLRLPDVEILKADFASGGKFPAPGTLKVVVYVAPVSEGRIVIPFHRCVATMQIGGEGDPIPLPDVRLEAPAAYHSSGGPLQLRDRRELRSLTMDSTDSEIIIDGPGRFSIESHQIPLRPEWEHAITVRVTAILPPLETNSPIRIDCLLTKSGRPDEFKFAYQRHQSDAS